MDYDFALVYVRNREKPELDHPRSTRASTYPLAFILAMKLPSKCAHSIRYTVERLWTLATAANKVTVQSEGNVHMHNPNGYAITTHRYREPGDDTVEATRANEHGHKSVMHRHLRVNLKRSFVVTGRGQNIWPLTYHSNGSATTT